MRELSHAGDDVIQGFYHFLMLDAFLDNDEDRVIASYGTNDFRNIAAVNVPGNGTGIAGARLDDAYVAGEIDADKPWHLHHLFDVAWRGDAFVHRVVGQDINVVPGHRGGLGHLQLLQIATQCGLRELETFFLECIEQFVLTAKLLA